MAHSFTGHRSADVPRVHDLCKTALYMALKPRMLKKGGTLVMKCLEGNGEQEILDLMRQYFKRVERFKPLASRQESSEHFLICFGFRPELDTNI